MASKPKDPKAGTTAKPAGSTKKIEVKDHKEIKEKDKEKDKDKDIKDKDKDKDKDHKDSKDQKEQKEHKEQKDHKEQKEHKDFKDAKDKDKDKDKEHKIEFKDHQKDLENKRTKPEFEKNTPENPKELVEVPIGHVNQGDPEIGGQLEQRLAALEGQVATFISGANRPDLSSGALKNEADQSGKKK